MRIRLPLATPFNEPSGAAHRDRGGHFAAMGKLCPAMRQDTASGVRTGQDEQKTTAEHDIGREEQQRLRELVLGERVAYSEALRRVEPYLRRHVPLHLLHRAAAKLPPNLPSVATRIITAQNIQACQPEMRPISVFMPVYAKNAATQSHVLGRPRVPTIGILAPAGSPAPACGLAGHIERLAANVVPRTS